MKKEEIIKRAVATLTNYYKDREKKKLSVDYDTAKEYYRILPDIEGVEEVFGLHFAHFDCPYSNEDDNPYNEEAKELSKKIKVAEEKYPLAHKAYNAWRGHHTVWRVDEVTPKMKEVIAEYNALNN